MGASHVIPFSSISRRQTYESVETAAQAADSADAPVPGLHPARWVHIDQSSHGAEVLGEDVPREQWPALREKHWAIINVWKPISDVSRGSGSIKICGVRYGEGHR